MTTPEGEIKKEIKSELKKLGAQWDMIQGGAYSKPGAPDMIILYKGVVLWAEIKTPTGKQSNIQKLREKEIRGQEGHYILARSSGEVIAELLRLTEDIS